MPPPVKMPIRAVRAALVWFRKTTALDGKAGIGAGAAIDPVAPKAVAASSVISSRGLHTINDDSGNGLPAPNCRRGS